MVPRSMKDHDLDIVDILKEFTSLPPMRCSPLPRRPSGAPRSKASKPVEDFAQFIEKASHFVDEDCFEGNYPSNDRSDNHFLSQTLCFEFDRARLKPKDFSYECDWNTYFEHVEWPLTPSSDPPSLESNVECSVGPALNASDSAVSTSTGATDITDTSRNTSVPRSHSSSSERTPLIPNNTSTSASDSQHAVSLSQQHVSKPRPLVSKAKLRLDQPYGPHAVRPSNSNTHGVSESTSSPAERHVAASNNTSARPRKIRAAADTQTNTHAQQHSKQLRRSSSSMSSRSSSPSAAAASQISSPSAAAAARGVGASKFGVAASSSSGGDKASRSRSRAGEQDLDFADALAAKMQTKEDEEKRARVNNCYMFAQMGYCAGNPNNPRKRGGVNLPSTAARPCQQWHRWTTVLPYCYRFAQDEQCATGVECPYEHLTVHQLAAKGKAFYMKHKEDAEYVARQAKIDEHNLQKKRRWSGVNTYKGTFKRRKKTSDPHRFNSQKYQREQNSAAPARDGGGPPKAGLLPFGVPKKKEDSFDDLLDSMEV